MAPPNDGILLAEGKLPRTKKTRRKFCKVFPRLPYAPFKCQQKENKRLQISIHPHLWNIVEKKTLKPIRQSLPQPFTQFSFVHFKHESFSVNPYPTHDVHFSYLPLSLLLVDSKLIIPTHTSMQLFCLIGTRFEPKSLPHQFPHLVRLFFPVG